MKKNIFSLLVVMVALFIPSSIVNASRVTEENEIEIGLKNYLGDNYKDIIEKNTNSANNIEKIKSIIRKNTKINASDDIYPDYVGGFYIDDQNEVVIQIVDKKVSALKAKSDYNLYTNILSVDQNANIEYVNYSYNEINEVISVLENYYLNNYDTGNIVGYYDDIKNNRVVVELKNYSKEDINNFKKEVIDSSLIYFTKSKGVTTVANVIYMPGQRIFPVACSLGFRAKIGNNIGVISAAHCFESGLNQNVVNYGVVKKYQFSGNVDAAWIDLDSMYTVGSGLAYGPKVNGLSLPLNNSPVSSFVTGALYGKAGYRTEYTYGTITSTNASGAEGITGVVKTNADVNGGDSGGIVFKISGTGANPTAYQTAGIVHCSDVGGGNMRFVKATNIVSSFGLTTY